jgi:hypothetical protein
MSKSREKKEILEIGFGRGIAHVVEYKAYSKNPLATEMMDTAARRYLTKVIGPMNITFGRPFNTGRAVSKSDYDFGIVAVFPSQEAMNHYMNNKNHMAWVRFVLNGYQIPDSKLKTPGERKEEFIECILRGTKRFEYARDSAVPDSEVVWGGESVKDLGSI